jgi:DNA modification methylase
MNIPRNEFLQGDAIQVLRSLPDNFVQTCVTSPPYYALRDYGVDGQIGLEESPEVYVSKLVEVFAEVRRVLRSDGTLWINIGDTYANDSKWGGHSSGKHVKALHSVTRPRRYTQLPGKSLIGIPWRLAFALQDDGWILRSDIIWFKTNAMPESVLDRPTKAHEYLFLLAKQPDYYYDADAIREPLKPKTFTTYGINNKPGRNDALGKVKSANWAHSLPTRFPRLAPDGEPAGANKRTVWSVASQPFEGAHFATFPPKLIEPCILAGSRPGDIVLDPFMGAGTVALVAIQHQRDYLGIELNPAYIDLAQSRIAQVQPILWDLEVAS